MKKTPKFIFSIILSIFLFSFFSCNDAIFSDIRNEVELDNAKISGPVLSIVRYKDNIFAVNGRVYYQSKFAAKRSWIEMPTNMTGIIYDLAANQSNLYACTLLFEDDNDGYNVPTTRTLWRYDGSSWSAIYSAAYSSLVDFYVFCTNTPKEANRKAFFKYGSSVYELNDTSENYMAELTPDDEGNGTLSDGSNYTISGASISSVKSATVLNGEVILSIYRATTSDETEESEATYVYTATGSVISYSTDGTYWTTVSTNSDDILSIGFSQDYMLLGTDEGIQHVLISDNVPQSSIQDFNNNAASALSSYYVIDSLLVVDPSKSEYTTPIFASTEFDGSSSSTSATLTNVGLWGYYPSKGEWNRQ